MPPRLFRARGLRVASVALGLNGAGFLAMFFLTAIYLQQVRGDSALLTGLQLLPMGGAAILAAVTVSELVTRIGTRVAQVAGAVLSLGGLVLLSQAGATSAYATSLLPGFVLFGAGIISIGVPAQIAAVAEVREHDAGAASGVVTACYQVGGALGLAVITTIADSRVTHLAGRRCQPGARAHRRLSAGHRDRRRNRRCQPDRRARLASDRARRRSGRGRGRDRLTAGAGTVRLRLTTAAEGSRPPAANQHGMNPRLQVDVTTRAGDIGLRQAVYPPGRAAGLVRFHRPLDPFPPMVAPVLT